MPTEPLARRATIALLSFGAIAAAFAILIAIATAGLGSALWVARITGLW